MPARIAFAKGRITRRIPGTMTKLEQRYAEFLECEKRAGLILKYGFETVRLKLADKCYANIDFYVLLPDGSIEMVEVKGSWKAPNQDKSRVKLKVAAEQYPEFHFVAVTALAKKLGGGWQREEIG